MELHAGKSFDALVEELKTTPLTAEEKASLRKGFALLENQVRAAADQGFYLGDLHGRNLLLDRKTGKVSLIDFDQADKGYSIADGKRQIATLQRMIDHTRPPNAPTIAAYKSLQAGIRLRIQTYEKVPDFIRELRESLLGE